MTTTASAFFSDWSDFLALGVAIVALFVANRCLQWGLNAFAKKRDSDVRVWTSAVLESLGPPLRAIIWLIGLSIVASLFIESARFPILDRVFPPTRDVAVILAASWFLFRFVGRVEVRLHARAAGDGEPIDQTAADAVVKLLRASIAIVAVLVVMQTLGFSIGGLLAFGGAAGIAVGFAAQSLVANLLGGLTIFASRIFKIGEYIILPGTDLMGEVQHIGWRATRVLGFDCKPFYVPNSLFNSTTVINHSRMTNRRIMEYVRLRYKDIDKVRGVVDEVNAMIEARSDLDHGFYVFRFDSCGDYAIKLFLYAFTVTTSYTEYMAVKEDVLLTISTIIREQGAQLAVPVSNVHIPDGLRIGVDSADAKSEPLLSSAFGPGDAPR